MPPPTPQSQMLATAGALCGADGQSQQAASERVADPDSEITIAALKKFIEGLPDEMPVRVAMDCTYTVARKLEVSEDYDYKKPWNDDQTANRIPVLFIEGS